MNSKQLLDALDREPAISSKDTSTRQHDETNVVLIGQASSDQAPRLVRQAVLSKGTYGLIYRGWMPEAPLDVAIKYLMPVPKPSRSQPSDILTNPEFAAMRSAQHNNLIHTIGSITRDLQGNTLHAIIMPYVKYTLFQLRSAQMRVPEPCVAYVAYSLLSALRYMHEDLNLIHGDLHPRNVLVSYHGRVVLTDLGLTRPRSTYYNQTRTSRICALWYRAPELILADRYFDVAVDCWSLGVTILELALGQAPIRTTLNADRENDSAYRPALHADLFSSMFRLLGAPDKNTWPFYARACSSRENYLPPPPAVPWTNTLRQRCRDRQLEGPFVDFIQDLLTYSPALRLQASDGLEHPWLCQKFPLAEWQQYCGHLDQYGVTREPPVVETSAPTTLAASLECAYRQLSKSRQHPGQRMREDQRREQTQRAPRRERR